MRRLSPYEATIAVACVLFGFFIRCVHVGYREITGPEFFTIRFINGEQPPFLRSIFEGKLPLYYEFMRVWGDAFGTQSETVLRLPSVVFGLLACIAFLIYSQRFLRGTAFAVAMLAMALNPVLVYSSIEASPFALLSLFVVLANYFCVRALNEGGRKHWGGYAITAALGAAVHPLFWFLLVAHFIFAAARPRKTPRPFLLISLGGIMLAVVLVIFAAVYANANFPRKVEPEIPVVDDVARGIVAVVLGNFPRYGSVDFTQALMYLFVIVTLSLSFYYYWMRSKEAEALPEGVMWIDETQDVVGKWRRLSLASFLLFQWFTFGIPACGIMVMGSFASRIELHPEYFLICLPSLVFLVAAGIDAAPGNYAKITLIGLFVISMGFYNAKALTDKGPGVYDLFQRVRKENFDPSRDALLYVFIQELEPSVERYSKGIKGIPFSRNLDWRELQRRLDEVTRDRERVFVFFHKDVRRVGRGERSVAEDWFEYNRDRWKPEKSWLISEVAQSKLKVYRRINDATGPAVMVPEDTETTAPAAGDPSAAAEHP
jgi:hypothetical protein